MYEVIPSLHVNPYIIVDVAFTGVGSWSLPPTVMAVMFFKKHLTVRKISVYSSSQSCYSAILLKPS